MIAYVTGGWDHNVAVCAAGGSVESVSGDLVVKGCKKEQDKPLDL